MNISSVYTGIPRIPVTAVHLSEVRNDSVE